MSDDKDQVNTTAALPNEAEDSCSSPELLRKDISFSRRRSLNEESIIAFDSDLSTAADCEVSLRLSDVNNRSCDSMLTSTKNSGMLDDERRFKSLCEKSPSLTGGESGSLDVFNTDLPLGKNSESLVNVSECNSLDQASPGHTPFPKRTSSRTSKQNSANISGIGISGFSTPNVQGERSCNDFFIKVPTNSPNVSYLADLIKEKASKLDQQLRQKLANDHVYESLSSQAGENNKDVEDELTTERMPPVPSNSPNVSYLDEVIKIQARKQEQELKQKMKNDHVLKALACQTPNRKRTRKEDHDNIQVSVSNTTFSVTSEDCMQLEQARDALQSKVPGASAEMEIHELMSLSAKFIDYLQKKVGSTHHTDFMTNE